MALFRELSKSVPHLEAIALHLKCKAARRGRVQKGVLVVSQPRGDWVEFGAAGAWTAEYASSIEQDLNAAIGSTPAHNITINLRNIEFLDTYGAWLIERAIRRWRQQGREAKLVGLREDYRGVFEKVQAGTQALSPEPPKLNAIMAMLVSTGVNITTVAADLVL